MRGDLSRRAVSIKRACLALRPPHYFGFVRHFLKVSPMVEADICLSRVIDQTVCACVCVFSPRWCFHGGAPAQMHVWLPGNREEEEEEGDGEGEVPAGPADSAGRMEDGGWSNGSSSADIQRHQKHCVPKKADDGTFVCFGRCRVLSGVRDWGVNIYIFFNFHYYSEVALFRECHSFTFTFRAFGRRFYPKRLTKSTFVEGDSNISLWYIKRRIEQFSSIHSCEANRTSFIIARLPASYPSYC